MRESRSGLSLLRAGTVPERLHYGTYLNRYKEDEGAPLGTIHRAAHGCVADRGPRTAATPPEQVDSARAALAAPQRWLVVLLPLPGRDPEGPRAGRWPPEQTVPGQASGSHVP
ncbi:hypothetical protein [Nonomuraea sp. GTA35]|uniref:hypothetical protein n=1 Tax=Nonomuraea sp. GTA35 TaxID=1676746 RepID=UPI0035C14EAC